MSKILPPVLNPIVRVPTGIDRLGFPSYGKLPGGVPNPPNAMAEAQELAVVRLRNALAQSTPQGIHFTEYLSKNGGTKIWGEFAKQYRHNAGFLRGWVGTGLMYAAMGISTIRAQSAKSTYQRLRPYQIDSSIKRIGKEEKDASYPSGHSTAAFAASTVLSALWPQRASEFGWWANQVAQSRMAAGMHFPSDVQAGAILGTQTGLNAVSFLYS